jgi:hypothetical protein
MTLAAERADAPRTRTLLPIKHVTFRPGHMGDALLARHEAAGTAAREIVERYLWLMRRYKPTLRLSIGEASVVVTALRTFELTDTTLDMVWVKVEAEARQQSLAQVHGVDLEPLVLKLRGFSPVQTVALLDGVRVFWRSGADAAALEASGLV